MTDTTKDGALRAAKKILGPPAVPTYQAAAAIIREETGCDELADIAKRLDEFQTRFTKNTLGDSMPGNEFYASNLMAIVDAARAALAKRIVDELTAERDGLIEAEHLRLCAEAENERLREAFGELAEALLDGLPSEPPEKYEYAGNEGDAFDSGYELGRWDVAKKIRAALAKYDAKTGGGE